MLMLQLIYSPVIPSIKITPDTVSIAHSANIINNFLEFIYFIKKVLINRLYKKIDIAIML